MRVAITGASGQLGRVLATEFSADVFSLSKHDLNILDTKQIESSLKRIRPDVLLNCAAYTDVDGAEQNTEQCFSVNAVAVAMLANVCSEIGCKFVHISSDYVFEGTLPCGQAYRESDHAMPSCVYGRSKLMGEIAALRIEGSLVVRTCGIYSDTSRKNFVATILRVAATQKTLRVVSDQWCTPTYAPHLANAISFLVERGATGNYHVTNSGYVSWHQFAEEIFRQAGRSDVEVIGITSGEYGAPARRPANSVLDIAKYVQLGGPAMPNWDDALSECIRERC